MQDRYLVTEPTEHGYAWWNVVDLEGDIMPNFAVATFWKGMPGAGVEARTLCDHLNFEHKHPK